MDPVTNPYAPGAGKKPAALVGRDEAIRDWGVSMQRAERGNTDQPFVLYGLRGVGKTVLLTQLRHDAEARGWIVVQQEAGTKLSLRELIGEALYEPLYDLQRPSAGQKFLNALKTALSFKASYDSSGTWNFGLDLTQAMGGGADTGILQTDLRKVIRDVSQAAREEGIGLAILLDEAQDVDPEELKTLAAITQVAAQDNWPVLFALAGLPSLPQLLAEAKSYTERFRYEYIERLSEGDAREAIIQPARQEGVLWEEEAIARITAASERYPYFLQQFGQDTWLTAERSPITSEEASRGIEIGWRKLDNGFFRARWDRATALEKKYLQAMCPGGDDGIASSEVAKNMNKSLSSLGPTRAQLIHKGLVYSPDHGVIRFTVPGMEAFVTRQAE